TRAAWSVELVGACTRQRTSPPAERPVHAPADPRDMPASQPRRGSTAGPADRAPGRRPLRSAPSLGLAPQLEKRRGSELLVLLRRDPAPSEDTKVPKRFESWRAPSPGSCRIQ